MSADASGDFGVSSNALLGARNIARALAFGFKRLRDDVSNARYQDAQAEQCLKIWLNSPLEREVAAVNAALPDAGGANVQAVLSFTRPAGLRDRIEIDMAEYLEMRRCYRVLERLQRWRCKAPNAQVHRKNSRSVAQRNGGWFFRCNALLG